MIATEQLRAIEAAHKVELADLSRQAVEAADRYKAESAALRTEIDAKWPTATNDERREMLAAFEANRTVALVQLRVRMAWFSAEIDRKSTLAIKQMMGRA